MEQVERLTALLEPVKDKVLLITQGNHEARTYRNDGIDLTAMVAMRLGLADLYCREGGLLFLRFGRPSDRHGDKAKRMLYSIYATHGSGGGRKEGAKAIRLADMAAIVDADIYVHSHTHLPMVMKQGFFKTNTSTSSVAKVDKLFVNTAASLEYSGYGQAQEFKPTSIANPVIYLDGHNKKMTAKI